MADPDTLPPDRDLDLMRRLSNGESGAIADLYDLYFDRLYSLVFNQVDRNRDSAEDIIQETFLAAIKSAKSFRGQSSIYTWLCSIAYHKIADHYRRQARERKHLASDVNVDEVDTTDSPGRQNQPESMFESTQTRQIINQALAKLPLDYRQVLILKYIEEMSVLEISQIMGRSPKAIEGLLTRSRKALQAHLAELREG